MTATVSTALGLSVLIAGLELVIYYKSPFIQEMSRKSPATTLIMSLVIAKLLTWLFHAQGSTVMFAAVGGFLLAQSFYVVKRKCEEDNINVAQLFSRNLHTSVEHFRKFRTQATGA